LCSVTTAGAFCVAGLAACQQIETDGILESDMEGAEAFGENSFELSPCIAREYGIYGEYDASAAAAAAAVPAAGAASGVAAMPSAAVEFLADQQCTPLFMPGRLLGIGGMQNCKVGIRCLLCITEVITGALTRIMGSWQQQTLTSKSVPGDKHRHQGGPPTS
jgi:hypothetical protein